MDERGHPRSAAAAALRLPSSTSLATPRSPKNTEMKPAAGVADVVHEVAVGHGGRRIKWSENGAMMQLPTPTRPSPAGST